KFAFDFVIDPEKTTQETIDKVNYLVNHPEVLVDAAKAMYHNFNEGTPEQKAEMLGNAASILVPGVPIAKSGVVGKLADAVMDPLTDALKKVPDALENWNFPGMNPYPNRLIPATPGGPGPVEVPGQVWRSEGMGKPKVQLGKEDLGDLRKKWNVPETETIAIGKTDVKGLEDLIFEGGSPMVRKEAGLSDLDEIMPDRPIQAPRKSPQFTRHAEEGVINDFVGAVEKAGLKPEEVRGTFYIHQSNSKGVCTACIQGISNPNVKPGIFMQLSQKYPNLIIKVTSEVEEGIKLAGKLKFTLKGGKLID
ncbi:hypothetical protein NST04_25840, partial [Paenibacillus sp. FSL H7-0756]